MASVGKNVRAKMAKDKVMGGLVGTLNEMGAIKVGGDYDYVVPVNSRPTLGQTEDGTTIYGEPVTTYVGLTLTAKNDVTYQKDGEVVLAAFDPDVAIAKYAADLEIKEAKKIALAAERAAAKEAKAKVSER